MVVVGHTLDPTTGQSEVVWDVTLLTDVTATDHRRKGKVGAHKRGFGKKGKGAKKASTHAQPLEQGEQSEEGEDGEEYEQGEQRPAFLLSGGSLSDELRFLGHGSAESGWRMAVVDSSTLAIGLPRVLFGGATLRVVRFFDPGSGHGGARDEQSAGGGGGGGSGGSGGGGGGGDSLRRGQVYSGKGELSECGSDVARWWDIVSEDSGVLPFNEVLFRHLMDGWQPECSALEVRELG